MRGLNVEWALAELDDVIQQAVLTNNSGRRGGVMVSSRTAAPDSGVTKQVHIVEKVLDRVLPHWRNEIELKKSNRWTRHREAAIRAKKELLRQEEARANLGDDAPEISASSLHPWIWSGAASLWRSGHFHSAVEDAAEKINAEAQNKVGRRDLGETKLFQEAFTEKPAEAGKARLRRMTPDGSDTYKSLQRGAMALAEGIFAGVRNPLSHEADQELDEQVALEYLAALSVLARWVDESSVERAGHTR